MNLVCLSRGSVDVNECLDESVCDGGECLNTDGSFNCFCRPPMVLSPKSNRCVVLPQLAGESSVFSLKSLYFKTVLVQKKCGQKKEAHFAIFYKAHQFRKTNQSLRIDF